ncbi:MAG: RHS repeat-associated core domain-containing protein, partial [Proteobacteria bacterium]|nr:RHS repeat-associated core domain-containing protein [Pseudomonadota bacterium]
WFTPFGEPSNGSYLQGPGYAGHVSDAASHLTYAQQRYYDPVLGRFLSADPVQADDKGGDFNRYWYANDNPYKFTDVDGRTALGIMIADAQDAALNDNQPIRAFFYWTAGTIVNDAGLENLGGPVITYKAGIPPPSAAVSKMLTCTANCTGSNLRVTETSGSHKPTDPHSRGLAADVTTKDPTKVMQCAANCGAKYQQNEYSHRSPNATGGHVHLQLVPGRGGATGPYFPSGNGKQNSNPSNINNLPGVGTHITGKTAIGNVDISTSFSISP